MKNILIIANYKKDIGGISGQVKILLEKLRLKNVQCDLFNVKVSNLKRIFLPLKMLYSFYKYDIFYIHGCSFRGFLPIFIGIVIGKLLRKKIIVTYHGGGLKEFIQKHPLYVPYILKKANTLTIPSKYLYDILRKNNISSIILPNIIRTDNVTFKKREIINPTIIVTRSLEKVYNISMVINAFSIIKSKFEKASLRIIGDGYEKDNLIKLVKALGLSDVEFVGRVKNSEIGCELNKADIFINPSTQDSFAVSMFEAFACGLPVISTNVGAISNFVIDGENGFLINSGDVEQLATKIEYILMNQYKIKLIIENAYNTFQKYTWENLKKEYIELYKEKKYESNKFS